MSSCKRSSSAISTDVDLSPARQFTPESAKKDRFTPRKQQSKELSQWLYVALEVNRVRRDAYSIECYEKPNRGLEIIGVYALGQLILFDLSNEKPFVDWISMDLK